jgi:predicted phosphodiesterase
VHLSDIHFGRVDKAIIEPLIQAVRDANPAVVAVSGDLTQRARSSEFKEARAFLDALPQPQIVVPGNHDIPLHNVFLRFARPLDNYRRYISDDMRPSYEDDEMAVVGLNTARSMTVKGGRINNEPISWLREKLCAFGPDLIKIIVTHHPFDLPESYGERDLVRRARKAIGALAGCGADIFLAGHLHVSHRRHRDALQIRRALVTGRTGGHGGVNTRPRRSEFFQRHPPGRQTSSSNATRGSLMTTYSSALRHRNFSVLPMAGLQCCEKDERHDGRTVEPAAGIIDPCSVRRQGRFAP